MDAISKYVSYAEATQTSTGLPNIPDKNQLASMRLVAACIFDMVREHFGKPIGINSFFRAPAVNKAVGGSPTSDHVKGGSIDINGPEFGGPTNAEVFQYIKDNLDFDQLIWEHGTDTEPAWVHASYRATGNRKQVLRAVKKNGKTVYLPA